MTDRLTPEREAEIRERIAKRTAAFTEWINRESPFDGQDTVQNAEAVLEEDVPALLAELAALREELAEQKRATEYFDAQSKRRKTERDAFRDQRNSVFATNERLVAEVQQSDQARLRAENETRTVKRELAAVQAERDIDDDADCRRRIYVDGKGDGWIDLTVDPATGERELTGITNPWKIASADEVRTDTGGLRKIGRCW